MTTTAIRAKLTEYIRHAEDKKVKAIYTIIESELNQLNEPWSENFVNEMESRLADLKTGKDKGNSWDQVKKKTVKVQKRTKK
jgi:hypothetical protein